MQQSPVLFFVARVKEEVTFDTHFRVQGQASYAACVQEAQDWCNSQNMIAVHSLYVFNSFQIAFTCFCRLVFYIYKGQSTMLLVCDQL